MAITLSKSLVVPDQVARRTVAKWVSAAFALTVSGGATPSRQGDIDVSGSGAFVIQLDNSGGASTSLTLAMFGSLDGGTTFDNEALASINLGAAKIKSAVVVGPLSNMRIKVTNGDAVNACAAVTVRIIGIV